MGVRIEGIEETKDLIKEASEDAIAGFVLEINNRVQNRTPVDTGFARNSWLVTFSKHDEGNPGNNEGASPPPSAIANRLPNPVFINNGAAYIGRLEDGHSQQAPNGMVDITLAEVDEIMDEQLDDIAGALGF